MYWRNWICKQYCKQCLNVPCLTMLDDQCIPHSQTELHRSRLYDLACGSPYMQTDFLLTKCLLYVAINERNCQLPFLLTSVNE